MKEFLRYLFVVAAMLMVVVGDVWGQTYNDGVWYSLDPTKSYTLNTIDEEKIDVFSPTTTNLTFHAKRTATGQGDLKVAPIVSGSQQSDIFSQKPGKVTKEIWGIESKVDYTDDPYSATTPINLTQLKFYTVTGATLAKDIKEIKLPLAKHILLDNSTAFGTSSITVTDGNLATAEGYTSTNAYKIKLRSFLASGNITMTSSNSEFHFGGGATTVSLGVANNYCASVNGSGGCGNGVLGHISTYYKNVYFSPSVQYNANARSTIITITDGVNTAYVYLTVPVIPTYYFKAEAIAEPTTAGVATATFVNGQSTYSLVAPNVGTNSMSTDVTFAASAGENSVFEGWKKPSEDSYYKQGVETASFKETITSSVLDPRGMASQKIYRAIFSERYTASMETNDISGLKVGGSATAVYSFINTSAAIPSSDENADFHYVITHRPDNTTKNGSADASKVVSFDPSTKQVVGMNSGSATITFVQKANANYVYVEKSFEVIVEKNDISAMIVKGDAVLNELVENAFTVTDGLQDYSVESLNSGIAEYVAGNKIQTYFTEGTAQFRVTRDEDYKYVGLNELFDLEVKKSEESCILFNTTHDEEYKVGYYDNEDGFEFNLGGEGASINLELKKQDGGGGHIYITGYTSSGTEVSLGDVKGSDLSTSWSKHTFDFPTDKDIVKIKIEAGNDIWNDALNKYFRNVQVTRKTSLDHQVSEGTLVLPQANMNQTSQKSFNLKWSTCAEEIKLVSDNDLFEVSTTQINATEGDGITEVLVTFKGSTTSGVHSANITIYDQTQVKELEVTCEVKEKLATEIIYSGETEYADEGRCIENMFSVKDENGDVVADAEIVLASSNEAVLEVCGNAGFMPHCGGTVTLTATYAGDEYRAGATWSKEIHVVDCYQHIVWDQDFRGYIAAEDGTINKTTELTAYSDPTGFAVTYELDAAAQSFARLENGSLVVYGVGTGHIIASVPAGEYEGKMYSANSVMHEIRVREWGDMCETEELLTSDEITLSDVLIWHHNSKEFELEGRPYARLEFYSHVSNESLYNDLTVSFSKDGGATWSNEETFNDIPNTYNWAEPYVHDNIPEGANRVKFTTNSTTNTYFNMVSMVQESYLRAKDMDGNNLDKIVVEDAIVNEPFSRTFTVEYSDVPLIQHRVTNNHDLGLTITPANIDIHNDCGDWGTFTFTLTGESPYPQTEVNETIFIYTSAGVVIEIPVVVTATLSEPFYFNVQDGDWNESTNWTYKGSTTHEMVPNKKHPVVISKALTISDELEVYGVEIVDGGSVNIVSNGGLTAHAGGFNGVEKTNFQVQNDLTGAGFVRVSKYFKKLGGTMPKMKVHFTTKANMNAGGNKDAAWQYIGAPGAETEMLVVNTSTLYLRSEAKGWVRQWDSNTALTPFAGYAFTQKDQPELEFTPRLFTNDTTITLTYTESGMKGDNLWANSYMAPIDIKRLTDEDFTGNIDKIVYLYNAGSWNEWNKDTSAISSAEALPGRYYAIPVGSARALDATYDQTVIPPMQGVYMVANSGGGSLKLNYEKHVWNCASDQMNHALRIAGKNTVEDDYLNTILRVRLQLNSQNSGADRMYLIQDSACTGGYDNGYDAPKQMMSGLMNIYTNEAHGKMEISATDQIDGMYLGFAAGEDEAYSMTFTSLIGEALYLYDLEQDTLVEMSDGGQYVFNASAHSTNDMRFQVLVNPELSDYLPSGGNNGVTTDVQPVQVQNLWVQDKVVYIANAPINSVLEVYTVGGVMVTKYDIGYAPCTIDLSELPTGVYMLRLNDKVYKFVCK